MNAILQTFAHNPILRFYFLSNRHLRATCPRKNDICISCQVDKIFNELHNGTEHPFGPSELLYSIWVSQRCIFGCAQQDAHEFFIYIVNRIHNECSPRGQSPHKTCNCIIHKTFSGVIQSDVTCLTCSVISTAFDPIIDFSLDILWPDDIPAGKAHSSNTNPDPANPQPVDPIDSLPRGIEPPNQKQPAVIKNTKKRKKGAGKSGSAQYTLIDCFEKYTIFYSHTCVRIGSLNVCLPHGYQ